MRECDVIASGTGPSFFSMLGACSALRELGIRPVRVACTSGSSIPFGLVYGAGLSAEFVYNQLIGLDFRSKLALRPWKSGLYDTTGVQKWIDKLTNDMRMGECYTHFSVNAVDVKNKRMHILNRETEPFITLGMAMRMTISIPGVFTPVFYKGKWFVDGGVMNNLMVDIYPDHPRPTLIFKEVDVAFETVGEVWQEKEDESRPSVIEIAMNSITAMMNSREELQKPAYPNHRLVQVKVKDINHLSPSEDEKQSLYVQGFRSVLENLRGLDESFWISASTRARI